jgi:hypothetical protein
MLARGVCVLGVGVDWAESFHDVALGRQGEGVIEQFQIEHGPAGVGRLVARCLELEPGPAEVRVVLETRHGLLVEALVDAGFTVLPVNPDLVARRRGPAKKKDDAEDARICCLLALDQDAELRRLIPHGETGTELRAIARDDERAACDERRIGNRLRADLLAVFPAAIDIAAGDLGSPVFLRLLERWPSAGALAAASRDEIEAFARSCRQHLPDDLPGSGRLGLGTPLPAGRAGARYLDPRGRRHLRGRSAGLRGPAALYPASSRRLIPLQSGSPRNNARSPHRA